MLLQFVRFDEANARSASIMLSKSAAVDDIWIIVNSLQNAYTSSAEIAVSYRERTRFTRIFRLSRQSME